MVRAARRRRWSAGEQACKPGSVRRRCLRGAGGAAVISLGPAVARGLEQPTRGSAGRLISPYLALLRVGFAWPARRRAAGGLLPRRCTLTGRSCGRRYVSVALSLGSPPLGVTQHPALRSPDFPRRRWRRDGPACSRSMVAFAPPAARAAAPDAP